MCRNSDVRSTSAARCISTGTFSRHTTNQDDRVGRHAQGDSRSGEQGNRLGAGHGGRPEASGTGFCERFVTAPRARQINRLLPLLRSDCKTASPMLSEAREQDGYVDIALKRIATASEQRLTVCRAKARPFAPSILNPQQILVAEVESRRVANPEGLGVQVDHLVRYGLASAVHLVADDAAQHRGLGDSAGKGERIG